MIYEHIIQIIQIQIQILIGFFSVKVKISSGRILHKSWQLSCHDMYKNMTWLDHDNQGHTQNDFHEISIMSS